MSEETKKEETALAKKEDKMPILAGARGLALASMDDIYRFAQYVSKSGLAPKGLESTEACFIVIEFGMELGLSPMMALQNIANINGRPALWGDVLPGLVKSSGLQEYYKETEIGTFPNDDFGYIVEVRRRGEQLSIKRQFTIGDAKKAGLWGKAGPWSQYPKRMLLMRPRSWALRDAFPDVMKGLPTAEEIRDVRDVEVEIIPEIINENKPQPEEVVLTAKPEKTEEPKTKAKETNTEPSQESMPGFTE